MSEAMAESTLSESSAIDVLSASPLFSHLHRPEIQLLLSRGVRRSYARYATLLRAGATDARSICVVLHGMVQFRPPPSAAPKPHVAASANPPPPSAAHSASQAAALGVGGLFGEASLFGAEQPCDVIALSGCEVLRLAPADLGGIPINWPAMPLLARRLAAHNHQLQQLQQQEQQRLMDEADEETFPAVAASAPTAAEATSRPTYAALSSGAPPRGDGRRAAAKSARSAHKGGVGKGAAAMWSTMDEQAYVDALRLIDRRTADMNAMLRDRRKRFENVLGYSPVSKLHSPRARRMHVASPTKLRPALLDTPNGLHVLDAIQAASLQRAGGHVEPPRQRDAAARRVA